MELTDTHCHIQSAGDGSAANAGERITREKWAKLGRSGDEIIMRAQEADVTRMVCVGCDTADSELAIDFVQDRPGCWASIGIHPHEAEKSLERGHLDAFAGLVTRPKVVAVGECGLDYYYEHSPKEAQIQVLRKQFELALKHDLSMIFHVRDAFDDFWPIFDEYPGIKGVLHSFTDSSENLDRAISKGLYIGVNGIATFAKNPAQIEVYKGISLSNLVLETDAPFLTPTPYRGTICEPYHIHVIGEFLAELRGESLETLATATTENALRLFKLQ